MRPGLNEHSNNKLVYIFYSLRDFYSDSTLPTATRPRSRPRGPRAPLNRLRRQDRGILLSIIGNLSRAHSVNRRQNAFRAMKYFPRRCVSAPGGVERRGVRTVIVSEMALQKAPKPVWCGCGAGLAGGEPLARSMACARRRRSAEHCRRSRSAPSRYINPACPLPAARSRSHLSVVASFWHHMQPTTITLNNYRNTILSALNALSETNL